MTDTVNSIPDPDPMPFGAGVPTESVEPVRLPPGLGHGPALDIRGQVVPPVEVANPTSTSAAMAPQPFVGWIIPASAGAPNTAPTAAVVPPPSPVAASAQDAPLPPPVASTQPAPLSAPTFASASTASSAPSASSGPGASTPPPASTPPFAATPLPLAPKPARRWWIAIAHLAYLIPFPPGVLVTAAVWIWRRSRDPLMADQGREALNMQLTFWLAMGILGATCVASPIVPFVYVLGAVLCILAAIAAWGGDRHRYPWVFRFLT